MASHPHTGPAILESKDQPSADEEEMLAILQELGFCCLNTCSGKHKGTCIANGHVSQIDFIPARIHQADGAAKRAASLPEISVGAWKSNRRYPMHALIKLVQPWSFRNKTSPYQAITKPGLQHDIAISGPKAEVLLRQVELGIQQAPTPGYSGGDPQQGRDATASSKNKNRTIESAHMYHTDVE